MSDKKTDPNKKNNNRRRPSASIRDFDTRKMDETLETLDKGSPKLNWIYVLLTMIIIFLIVWVVMLLNPEAASDQAFSDSAYTENAELEAEVESLESRIEVLEQNN